jgi:hypothetical protein
MRVVAKGDQQRNFLEDALLGEGAQLPASCIEQRPPEGLHRPKWTGSEWVEGKPSSEILASAKAVKIHNFAARAIDDLDATGLFTSQHGDRETLFVVAKTLKAICSQLGIPLDGRLDAIATTGDKAMSKKAAIEAAQSTEELEAIQWN